MSNEITEGIDPLTAGEVIYDDENVKGATTRQGVADAEQQIGSSHPYEVAPIGRKVINRSKAEQDEVAAGRTEQSTRKSSR